MILVESSIYNFPNIHILMEKTIFNDSFISKLLKGKYKTKVAIRNCDLEKLYFKQKVEFTVSRLASLPYNEARLMIQFWEDKNRIMKILNKHSIHNYKFQRDYYGLYTPGILDIFFQKGEFKNLFLKDIITKHYGFELAQKDSLNIMMFYTTSTSKEISVIHIYDDRGFREYYYLL